MKFTLEEHLSELQTAMLKAGLSAIGLELIGDKMSSLIEKIKQLVIKKARLEIRKRNKRKSYLFICPGISIMSTLISVVFSLP